MYLIISWNAEDFLSTTFSMQPEWEWKSKYVIGKGKRRSGLKKHLERTQKHHHISIFLSRLIFTLITESSQSENYSIFLFFFISDLELSSLTEKDLWPCVTLFEYNASLKLQWLFNGGAHFYGGLKGLIWKESDLSHL